MKRLLKFIINRVPRPLMQRLASWILPLVGLLYVGRGKKCPICGVERRGFLPYGYVTSRSNALCPNCLSLERHRLLWLYLERECDIDSGAATILHIAPEVSLIGKFNKIYRKNSNRYVTADLESPLAKIHFDVEQIPLENNYADVIICNHLLEHVSDDRAAMRELYRVMKSGGWGVMMCPVEYDRPTTFEDDTITDKKERSRIFGQYDHRRIYGLDYADRLREAGFKVEPIDYAATLDKAEVERFALCHDWVYVVRK